MFDSPILSYKLVCDGNPPLTNAFVRTRKPHPCCICAETIGKNQRVRRETRRSADGQRIDTRHTCRLCEDAIRASLDGDCDALDKRFALARRQDA